MLAQVRVLSRLLSRGVRLESPIKREHFHVLTVLGWRTRRAGCRARSPSDVRGARPAQLSRISCHTEEWGARTKNKWRLSVKRAASHFLNTLQMSCFFLDMGELPRLPKSLTFAGGAGHVFHCQIRVGAPCRQDHFCPNSAQGNPVSRLGAHFQRKGIQAPKHRTGHATSRCSAPKTHEYLSFVLSRKVSGFLLRRTSVVGSAKWGV